MISKVVHRFARGLGSKRSINGAKWSAFSYRTSTPRHNPPARTTTSDRSYFNHSSPCQGLNTCCFLFVVSTEFPRTFMRNKLWWMMDSFSIRRELGHMRRGGKQIKFILKTPLWLANDDPLPAHKNFPCNAACNYHKLSSNFNQVAEVYLSKFINLHRKRLRKVFIEY